MTIFALLELGIIWGTKKPRGGGFCHEDHRSSAKDLVKALLAIALGGNVKEVEVSMEQPWSIKWPRPHTAERVFPLFLLPGCLVALGGFFRATKSIAHRVQGAWFTSTAWDFAMETLGEQPTFCDFLVFTSGEKAPRPLYLQLIWWAGCRAQDLNGAAAKMKESRSPLFAVTVKSLAGCLDNRREMDRRLAIYVRNCKEACQGHRNLSVCTDKASVCGLGSGIQGSIFVISATNQAILATPQALFLVCTHWCVLEGLPVSPRIHPQTLLPDYPPDHIR